MKRTTARKASKTQSKTISKVAKTSAAKKVSPRRKTEEQALQMNAHQWFSRAYPNILAFHVPNGGLRNRKVAETLQRMGVKPGVYDYLMFPGVAKFAFEFKSTKGVLSDDQKNFAVAWLATGGRCFSVKTLEQFKSLVTDLIGPSFIELANQKPAAAALGVQEGV